MKKHTIIRLADGKLLFTPLILRATPMACVEGQERSGDGKCYQNITEVREFTIKRWVYSAEPIRPHASGGRET